MEGCQGIKQFSDTSDQFDYSNQRGSLPTSTSQRQTDDESVIVKGTAGQTFPRGNMVRGDFA